MTDSYPNADLLMSKCQHDVVIDDVCEYCGEVVDDNELSLAEQIEQLHMRSDWFRQSANRLDERADAEQALGHSSRRVQRIRDDALMKRRFADDCDGYARALMRKLPQGGRRNI